MSTLPLSRDPTLDAADHALEIMEQLQQPRPYLGASAVGGPCDRALWYGFRWATARRLPASSLKAIEDGHHGEDVMAERLRLVEGVTLWTVDEETGEQIGFSDHNGHFLGHTDGVIQGLLQAPKTPHVWEHKQVNEKKFAKLQRLVATDEKAALEQWDMRYFIQAQLYMHYLELPRHYLTCSTPGGRAQTSCRTEYQPEAARWAIDRARRIISAARPPLRISDDPEWFECRQCDYASLCHGQDMADIHCRTCAYSTATLDSSSSCAWICERHGYALSNSDQRLGCLHHLIHPDLMERHAELVNGDATEGTITYRMRTGTEFKNGYRPPADSESGVITSDEVYFAVNGGWNPTAPVDWMGRVKDRHLEKLAQMFGEEAKKEAAI